MRGLRIAPSCARGPWCFPVFIVPATPRLTCWPRRLRRHFSSYRDGISGYIPVMETRASAGAPASVWDDEVEAELAAGIGRERLQRITECLAIPPLTTCLRVNTRNADSDKVFGDLLMAAQAQGAAALPYRVPAIPEAILIPGSGPHAIDYSQCGTWIGQTGRAWC